MTAGYPNRLSTHEPTQVQALCLRVNNLKEAQRIVPPQADGHAWYQKQDSGVENGVDTNITAWIVHPRKRLKEKTIDMAITCYSPYVSSLVGFRDSRAGTPWQLFADGDARSVLLLQRLRLHGIQHSSQQLQWWLPIVVFLYSARSSAGAYGQPLGFGLGAPHTAPPWRENWMSWFNCCGNLRKLEACWSHFKLECQCPCLNCSNCSRERFTEVTK